MKKIALVAGVLLFILSSCSSDSNEKDTPVTLSAVLVKKIIEFQDGVETNTTDFVYNGNKIVSEVVAKKDLSVVGNIGFLYNYKTEYTYTGNLITNIKRKMNYLTNNTVLLNTDYVYDNNENLILSVREQSLFPYNHKLRVVYEKLNNNSIHYKTYSSFSSDNIETLDRQGKLTFDTYGNIVKSELLGLNSDYVQNGSYEYDSKLNARKNILGLNKIIFNDGLSPTATPLLINLDMFNIILKSNILFGYPDSTYNQYVYDANGYPSEMKEYHINTGYSVKSKLFFY